MMKILDCFALSSPSASEASLRSRRRNPRSKVSQTKRRLIAGAFLFALPVVSRAQTSTYVQTNIVSDGAVSALVTDSTLINPWGISIGPQFWIDSPGSGFSLVEDAQGDKAFAVAVPPANSSSAHGSPAGTVYNSDSTLFPITGGYAQFLFGTLDGTIAAWNSSTPQAVTVVNNSSKSASYTDIVIDKATTGTYLLAANFASGTVDVFNNSFAPAQLSGSFSDSTIPAGFAPFGIHSIGGHIFVTYAQRNAQGRENVGAGLGYVDEFDTEGNLLSSAIRQGNLNAPWGMALAPAGFGSFGGDLLVGNFGDGVINVYDPATFSLIGQVEDSSGAPIANPGLWEIVFGTNGVGDANTLYFAAGINAEKDGLFGSIALAQSTTGKANFSIAASSTSVTVTSSQPGTASISLVSQNGFSGTIALACSGLPANTSCTFSPSSLNLASAATAQASVSIAEVTSPSQPNPYQASRTGYTGGAALALLCPLGLIAFAGFRRRSVVIKSILVMAIVATLAFGVSGCGSSSPGSGMTTSGTPTTVQVMVTATSGSITQTIPISVSLQ